MRLLYSRPYYERGGDCGNRKKYNREELKKLISGHLCRCTGYENILNAMERIVEEVYQVSHKTGGTD